MFIPRKAVVVLLVADWARSGKGVRVCVSEQIRVAIAAHRPLAPGPPTHKLVRQEGHLASHSP